MTAAATFTPYIDWNDSYYDNGLPASTTEDVLSSFAVPYPHDQAKEIDIIAAFYRYEDYSGYAFVVYRDKRDGKVYEVNGSHCSCYGLEGQWEPEEVVVEELLNRPSYGSGIPDGAIRAALREALG